LELGFRERPKRLGKSFLSYLLLFLIIHLFIYLLLLLLISVSIKEIHLMLWDAQNSLKTSIALGSVSIELFEVMRSNFNLRFRSTFLALGSSIPMAETFRKFRGRDPSHEALLLSLGLKSAQQPKKKGGSD
jgi:Peptidase family M3